MGLSLECPVCESSRFRSMFTLKNCDVVRCAECRTVYVPSPLPEVTALYQSGYFASDNGVHGYIDYAGELDAHTEVFSQRLQETEMKLGGKGRLLDVGCALGHMGKVAQDRGWDTFVTDISEHAVYKSVSDFNLKGFVSPVGKLPVKNRKFDVVTLFDVIEHLSHPRELLTSVKKALDPRGMVYISTPDINSWSAKLMGRHWFHLKPEEHLVYFNPKTITKILNATGYDVIEIKPSKTRMALGDILMRLRRYSKNLCDIILFGLKFLRLDRKIISLYTGEMEVWARPKPQDGALAQNRKVFPVDQDSTPILGVVCCPNCDGDLYPENQQLNCMKCDSTFEIQNRVINFSKYAKRSYRKVANE